MKMSPPRRRAASAVIALAVVLAACGGSADDDASVVDASTTTAASADDAATTTEDDAPTTTEDDTATTTEDDAADDDDTSTEDADALAEAVNLQDDDFVGDWTSEPDDPTDGDIRECFTGLDDALVADASSDVYSREGEASQAQVSSTGFVIVDEDTAEALVDEAGTDEFARCTEDAFRANVGDALLDVSLDPVTESSEIGDQAGGLGGTVTIEDRDGNPVDGEVAAVLVRTGSVITGLSISVFGEAETGLDVGTLVDETTVAVADRQAAEVG